MTAFGDLRAILFDVFGTVVDWRTSVSRTLAAWGANQGIGADWPAVADSWRARYQPSMDEVRTGRRPWAILDVLHRETLPDTFIEHGIPVPSDADLDELTLAWHHLDPWPDVVPGLNRLRSGYTVGTLSNGNTALLEDLARVGGLPWDVLLGAETAQAYKPLPQAYLANVGRLELSPSQVMLVAAHNNDLKAAAALGLRTAFIARPTEHGPHQVDDLVPTGAWDVVAEDCVALAAALRG